MTKNRSGRICALLLMASALQACSPIDFANLVTSKSGYTVEQNISYGPHLRQKIDIYTPDNAATDLPAVLFFYGGRWQFGEKADYLFVGEALASKGFVTIIADYRLYPETRWRGFIQDAALAVAKTMEIESDRSIALAGHSAGAHLAAMAALDDDLQAENGIERCRLVALVGLAGPFDFLPIREPDVIEVFGPGEAGPETQPITYASAGDPPALLIHGLDDRTVVPRNSKRLSLALEATGVSAETKLYEDVGHIGLIASFAWPARYLSPALEDMSEYLKQLPPKTPC